VRLGAVGWRRENVMSAFSLAEPGYAERYTLTSHTAVLGLSADGKYELLRGRVRPYVASGLGVYHSSTHLTREHACVGGPSCTFVTDDAYTVGGASTVLGLHAAGGVAFALRRTQIFSELRVQSDVRGYGAPSHLFPVVIGLRF
jgi:hypothetical protein